MHRNKSVNVHQFAMIPRADIPRSKFDSQKSYKTTFDSGYLIPVYVDEVLPGDTINLQMTAFARLATPLFPIMDNMHLDSFFFFVPNRLVWENWQKFMGERYPDPDSSIDYTVPETTSPAGGYAVNSLQDYMGLPTAGQITGSNTVTHCAFWTRAYNLIWNEWFRDQNLQDSAVVDTDDGPDSPADYVLRRRGKRHDYFTSCLPWPQKGPDVVVPIGANAPVVLSGTSNAIFAKDRQTHVAVGGTLKALGSVTDGLITVDPNGNEIQIDPNGSLIADLSAATASSINAWREAFQLQRMLERDARGGTRYTEILKAHFGVTSPDARLQRPEYLGGGSTPVNFHPVPQTSGSPADTGYTDTPQGNLSAYGTASFSGHSFTKSFTEHCLILGFVCVRADLTYQQGLNRMWSRRTRFDFYWPALAHLGEQAVLNKEIYAQATSVDDEVFGYQERYAEYRYKPSLITGQFRSSYTNSLDVWHLSQDFSALPALNASFIVENPPVSRVIAVPSEPQFLFDAYFSFKCARPMPVFGVPGMIDHF